ncbi:MAG: chorismate mutase [Alphaproteobacteria bacterium]|nr:chorismate mutase [Alphaproteobacteria bacterium]
MSDEQLKAFRREIDRIDDALIELLNERAEVALKVGALKRSVSAEPVFLRPGREAEVLRRLAGRADNKFPAAVIARLWREIISATLRLETPYKISVFEPEPRIEGLSYLALARAYFGVESTLKPARTEAGVLRAIRDGWASIGVLPVPVDELPGEVPKEPWWVTLASAGDQRPNIVIRLPWLPTPVDGPQGLAALAVARAPTEPSGDDLTLVALETVDQTSRNRIQGAFRDAGLELAGAAGWQMPADQTVRWTLVELVGYLEESDSRLATAGAALGNALRKLVRLGAYARPPLGGGLSPATA